MKDCKNDYQNKNGISPPIIYLPQIKKLCLQNISHNFQGLKKSPPEKETLNTGYPAKLLKYLIDNFSFPCWSRMKV